MSLLKVFSETDSSRAELTTDLCMEIAEVMSDYDLEYGYFSIQESVQKVFETKENIINLKRNTLPLDAQHKYPYCSAMILDESYESFDRFRIKFLSEHELERDEYWLVMDGSALISFHINSKVIQLLCEAGDMFQLPAGKKVWIDFGQTPHIKIIRCTQQDEEQVMNYTGSKIPDMFPKLS